MRNFKIDTVPHGTHKVYKKANIELESGVTVLVGCNGCGKSTLLSYIKSDLKRNKIPYISFDNLHDGGHNALSEMVFMEDFATVSNMFCSSEGENIILNVGNFTRKIGKFINSGGKTKGDKSEDFIDNFAKLISDDKETKEEDNTEYWILFDAMDSGLSVDNVVEIKRDLFDTILEHTKQLGYTVHIVVSANEYEMCIGQKCFNVQAGKYVSIDSYEDFKKIILETRKYKDDQREKYFTSLKKKLEN